MQDSKTGIGGTSPTTESSLGGFVQRAGVKLKEFRGKLEQIFRETTGKVQGANETPTSKEDDRLMVPVTKQAKIEQILAIAQADIKKFEEGAMPLDKAVIEAKKDLTDFRVKVALSPVLGLKDLEYVSRDTKNRVEDAFQKFRQDLLGVLQGNAAQATGKESRKKIETKKPIRDPEEERLNNEADTMDIDHDNPSQAAYFDALVEADKKWEAYEKADTTELESRKSNYEKAANALKLAHMAYEASIAKTPPLTERLEEELLDKVYALKPDTSRVKHHALIMQADAFADLREKVDVSDTDRQKAAFELRAAYQAYKDGSVSGSSPTTREGKPKQTEVRLSEEALIAVQKNLLALEAVFKKIVRGGSLRAKRDEVQSACEKVLDGVKEDDRFDAVSAAIEEVHAFFDEQESAIEEKEEKKEVVDKAELDRLKKAREAAKQAKLDRLSEKNRVFLQEVKALEPILSLAKAAIAAEEAASTKTNEANEGESETEETKEIKKAYTSFQGRIDRLQSRFDAAVQASPEASIARIRKSDKAQYEERKRAMEERQDRAQLLHEISEMRAKRASAVFVLREKHSLTDEDLVKMLGEQTVAELKRDHAYDAEEMRRKRNPEYASQVKSTPGSPDNLLPLTEAQANAKLVEAARSLLKEMDQAIQDTDATLTKLLGEGQTDTPEVLALQQKKIQKQEQRKGLIRTWAEKGLTAQDLEITQEEFDGLVAKPVASSAPPAAEVTEDNSLQGRFNRVKEAIRVAKLPLEMEARKIGTGTLTEAEKKEVALKLKTLDEEWTAILKEMAAQDPEWLRLHAPQSVVEGLQGQKGQEKVEERKEVKEQKVFGSVFTEAKKDLKEPDWKNQDFYLVDEEHQLYAVLDGMGGPGGSLASQTGAEYIKSRAKEFEGLDAEQARRLVISIMNDAGAELDKVRNNKAEWESRGINEKDWKKLGTTLVLVKVVENTVIIGKAGDSRVYAFDPVKGMNCLTSDDSGALEDIKKETAQKVARVLDKALEQLDSFDKWEDLKNTSESDLRKLGFREEDIRILKKNETLTEAIEGYFKGKEEIFEQLRSAKGEAAVETLELCLAQADRLYEWNELKRKNVDELEALGFSQDGAELIKNEPVINDAVEAYFDLREHSYTYPAKEKAEEVIALLQKISDEIDAPSDWEVFKEKKDEELVTLGFNDVEIKLIREEASDLQANLQQYFQKRNVISASLGSGGEAFSKEIAPGTGEVTLYLFSDRIHDNLNRREMFLIAAGRYNEIEDVEIVEAIKNITDPTEALVVAARVRSEQSKARSKPDDGTAVRIVIKREAMKSAPVDVQGAQPNVLPEQQNVSSTIPTEREMILVRDASVVGPQERGTQARAQVPDAATSQEIPQEPRSKERRPSEAFLDKLCQDEEFTQELATVFNTALNERLAKLAELDRWDSLYRKTPLWDEWTKVKTQMDEAIARSVSQLYNDPEFQAQFDKQEQEWRTKYADYDAVKEQRQKSGLTLEGELSKAFIAAWFKEYGVEILAQISPDIANVVNNTDSSSVKIDVKVADKSSAAEASNTAAATPDQASTPDTPSSVPDDAVRVAFETQTQESRRLFERIKSRLSIADSYASGDPYNKQVFDDIKSLVSQVQKILELDEAYLQNLAPKPNEVDAYESARTRIVEGDLRVIFASLFMPDAQGKTRVELLQAMEAKEAAKDASEKNDELMNEYGDLIAILEGVEALVGTLAGVAGMPSVADAAAAAAATTASNTPPPAAAVNMPNIPTSPQTPPNVPQATYKDPIFINPTLFREADRNILLDWMKEQGPRLERAKRIVEEGVYEQVRQAHPQFEDHVALFDNIVEVTTQLIGVTTENERMEKEKVLQGLWEKATTQPTGSEQLLERLKGKMNATARELAQEEGHKKKSRDKEKINELRNVLKQLQTEAELLTMDVEIQNVLREGAVLAGKSTVEERRASEQRYVNQAKTWKEVTAETQEASVNFAKALKDRIVYDASEPYLKGILEAFQREQQLTLELGEALRYTQVLASWESRMTQTLRVLDAEPAGIIDIKAWASLPIAVRKHLEGKGEGASSTVETLKALLYEGLRSVTKEKVVANQRLNEVTRQMEALREKNAYSLAWQAHAKLERDVTDLTREMKSLELQIKEHAPEKAGKDKGFFETRRNDLTTRLALMRYEYEQKVALLADMTTVVSLARQNLVGDAGEQNVQTLSEARVFGALSAQAAITEGLRRVIENQKILRSKDRMNTRNQADLRAALPNTPWVLGGSNVFTIGKNPPSENRTSGGAKEEESFWKSMQEWPGVGSIFRAGKDLLSAFGIGEKN